MITDEADSDAMFIGNLTQEGLEREDDLAFVAACANARDNQQPPPDRSEFLLAHRLERDAEEDRVLAEAEREAMSMFPGASHHQQLPRFPPEPRPLPPHPAAQNVARRAQKQAESSWTAVTRKQAKVNSKGRLELNHQQKPKAPPAPNTEAKSLPFMPRVIDDTQAWSIRFPNPVPIESRITDREMFYRINSADKSVWNFQAVSARWSPNGGSIVIRFSGETKLNAIEFHQLEFLHRLNHGVKEAVFLRNFKWSKINIYNVPCIEDIDADGSEIFTDISTIEKQLLANPLYSRLNVTLRPRWMGDLTGTTCATVGFAFEDPFGDMAKDFTSHAVYLQGTRCPAKLLKEKVLLDQCQRCWRLGESHINCNILCRLCGEGHSYTTHQDSCLPCGRDGFKAAGRDCTHLSCHNCKTLGQTNSGHAANDPRCPSRNKMIKNLRDKNEAILEYQRQRLRTTLGRT